MSDKEIEYKARLMREAKRYATIVGIGCVVTLPVPLGKYKVKVDERGEPIGEIEFEPTVSPC